MSQSYLLTECSSTLADPATASTPWFIVAILSTNGVLFDEIAMSKTCSYGVAILSTNGVLFDATGKSRLQLQ